MHGFPERGPCRRCGRSAPRARGDVPHTAWSPRCPRPCSPRPRGCSPRRYQAHLPLGAFGPIPDLRRYFNAVMSRFRTGSPWRDVPESYGSWSTVYDRFRVWARDGVFQALMEAMIAEAAARDDVDLSLVSVDSTVARAHHHAAGMVVDPELLEGRCHVG
ncbi:transposase (plasmid) [Streptomyces sp. NBC_01340]|nr:transposase [Streptomyces sp. NBC_01340]